MKLELMPITRDEANAWVLRHHRHHGAVRAHRFALAATLDDRVVGVAIVGNPVARGLDDGRTVEVLRNCTDGTRNACSFLYGASWRAARALGFRRIVTYILASESGTSLRAAGWRKEAFVKGRSWSCKSRPRNDSHPTEDKWRFGMAA